MIVKNKQQLHIPCEPCVDIEEGHEIAIELWKEIEKHPDAIGLAANQIGINKRVFIMRHVGTINHNIQFINPKILQAQNKVIVKYEGCLSFPDDLVITERYSKIYVTALNHQYNTNCLRDMDAICFQHELDHLDGITMHDREYQKDVK